MCVWVCMSVCDCLCAVRQFAVHLAMALHHDQILSLNSVSHAIKKVNKIDHIITNTSHLILDFFFATKKKTCKKYQIQLILL